MLELNKVYQGDCLEVMKEIDDKSIDMVITSPPYDNLRSYNGYIFNFEEIAKELFRIIKDGSVVVWIVGDATIKGSETGTSFKQALYFKEIGFNLHDTMIWNKGGFSAVGALKTRYAPVFEYMFIFTKGNIKTFNPIKDKNNKTVGRKLNGTNRQKDGATKPMANLGYITPKFGQRFNIWDISAEMARNKGNHPAMFPEQLIIDHILSWSNTNNIILDPMIGSGTTAIAALNTGRHYIGIEISKEYIDICNKRINDWWNGV